MKRSRNWITGGALAVALIAVGMGAGIAQASPGGPAEQDIPISGDALGRASAEALAHTGGGRVTETEVGDEDGYYEVEVTRTDSSQTDVHLDRALTVLGSLPDHQDGPR